MKFLIIIFTCVFMNLSILHAQNVEQIQKVVSPHSLGVGNFGFSTAIDGDIAIVGDNFGDNWYGRAYVFYKNTSGIWNYIKKLKPIDSLSTSEFGYNVGISGEYVIVGTFMGNDDGRAYVFHKNKGGTDNWGQVAKLEPSSASSNSLFGFTVAISGDLAIVGAPGDTINSNGGAGSVFVYQADEGGIDNWGETKKIIESNSNLNNGFGSAIDIDSETIIVGSVNSSVNTSVISIFDKDQGGTSNWGETKRIETFPTAGFGDFYRGLTISGDILAAGALLENSSRGAAYIFGRDVGGVENWGQIKRVQASDGEPGDNFGNSISISQNKLLVSAYGKNNYTGASYLFLEDQGGTDNWGEVQIIEPSDGEDDDQFSIDASISNENMIVGSWYDDDIGQNTGSAYFFESRCDVVHHSDLIALDSFYHATNGDNWVDNTGWLENCDPCGIEVGNDPWFGITCIGGEIRQIQMFFNNLTGTLPPEIGDFLFLDWLDLPGNEINGEIPQELCNLTSLRYLALTSNNFVGEVPACVKDLEHIELFHVSGNFTMTGPLPEFGAQNPSLTSLSFYNNQFSGDIPPSYGDIPNLNVLLTVNNDMSGDYDPNLGSLCPLGFTNANISNGNNFNEDWEVWCNVPCAYVPDDEFEQALIDEGYDTPPLDDCVPVPNIENVLVLDVSNEGIEDLTGIEFFTSLENLNCSNNDLVSIDLSSNTALTTLDASNNMISCFNIGAQNLSNLTSFYVQNNNIAGCWPEEMNGLCGLVNYNFDGNYYDGTANFISNTGWVNYCNNGDGGCVGSFDGWQEVGDGANNWVFALDVFDNEHIYAGGWFTSIGGQSANYIGKWNSSTDQWDALGTGMNGGVDAIATDANGDVYVGGFFTTAGSQPASYIAKWDANLLSWESLGLGVNNGVRSLLVAANGDIYAGGLFTEAGGQPVNYIAKWDDNSTSWEALGSGLNAGVRAIIEDASGNIYAGGYFTESNGQQLNYIAKWDINLNSWEPLGIGLNSWVNSLAFDNSGNLIAAGAFTEAGGQPANHIARYNTSNNSWESLGTGFNWSTYTIVVDNNNDIIVGGGFLQVGNQTLRYIAKWDDDNSVWESLGTGVNHRVHALDFDQNGDLYAGGVFYEAGGIAASRIAKYVFCKDETIITCELPDGTYSAGDLIQSTTPVDDGAQVILNAPNIVLNPGFSISVGSQLETQGDGCN